LSSHPVQDFPNDVVPQIDVRPFLDPIPKPPPADPGVTIVSVDILSILGSASSAISSDTSVFYDTEILAIVRRAKVKSSGLVETMVWGWIGKDARAGSKEEKALAELAKRYGTKLVGVILIPSPQRKLKLDFRSPSGSTTNPPIWLPSSVAHWPSVRYVEVF